LVATLTFTALAGSGTSDVTLTNANATVLGSYTDPGTGPATISFTAPTPPPPPSDTTPPTVTISSPANGATGTKFSVKASAVDDVGVTKMELYTDNKLNTTSTTGSLSYTLNIRGGGKKGGSTTTAHTLVVKAYDAAGNVGSSTITVY
jgi:hypothetical protein